MNTLTTPEPTVNGAYALSPDVPTFRAPGTALGPVIDDLEPHPEDKPKSGARLRRERLWREDVTTRAPLEVEGETVHILTWGRFHRPKFRDEVKRAMEGDYSLDSKPLDVGMAHSVCAALFGIETEDGDPFFNLESVYDYRADAEDSEFISACVWAVYEANPKIWDPEDVAAARRGESQDAESEEAEAESSEAATDTAIDTTPETKEEVL